MAIQNVSLGTAPTGVGGDTHRSAWEKAQANFEDLDKVTVSVKSSAYTFVEADNRGVFVVPSGTFAFEIPDALSPGWTATVLNYGSGVITFAPDNLANIQPANVSLDNTGGAELTAASILHLGSEDYRIVGPALENVVLVVPLSDETTALTVGTAKFTMRMPFAMTLIGVRASVNTAPTGSVLTVGINESGSSILSPKLTIDANEKTSTTATTAAIITDATLADDAEITFDIDTVGSTVAGAGLKVTMFGYRS